MSSSLQLSTRYRRNGQTSNSTSSTPVIHPDIDPAPIPRPIYQLLAIGFILFLAFLQFLPATHFRNPYDSRRIWFPILSTPSSSSSSQKYNYKTPIGGEDGFIHVVSWMDCLDLRVLAVLANSTLSSSRYPDLVYFHFFIPDGDEDKVSYYKLKVLFPRSKLEILGQNQVREIIRTLSSGEEYAGICVEELAPFVISSAHQSLSKFIYFSPNVIIKGRVEELTAANLTHYAIAATEDCSERLNTYVKTDVLNAIQRSASKPWVSQTPYVLDACMPDLSVFVIDARQLEGDFLISILWWIKVLNPDERRYSTNPAIALALYDKYHKLSTAWLASNASVSENTGIMVLHYDGPKKLCSEIKNDAIASNNHGNHWREFIPSMSDQILGN